jgi:hypothetical protein
MDKKVMIIVFWDVMMLHSLVDSLWNVMQIRKLQDSLFQYTIGTTINFSSMGLPAKGMAYSQRCLDEQYF